MIILTDTWSIEKSGNSFNLIEKYQGEKLEGRKRTGEKVEKEKIRFYGTLYQALKGFLHHYAGMGTEEGMKVDDIVIKVCEATRAIKEAERQMKEKYRIVKVVK